MNPIIEKCVAELGKDTPSLDYIRGMLESLLVMNAPFPRANVATIAGDKFPPVPIMSDEETTLISAYEKGPIGKITA